MAVLDKIKAGILKWVELEDKIAELEADDKSSDDTLLDLEHEQYALEDSMFDLYREYAAEMRVAAGGPPAV